MSANSQLFTNLFHTDLVIPPDVILRDPVCLIPDEPELLEQLEAYIVERRWNRKARTAPIGAMS
jgi:hypothetical protein